MVGAFAGNGGTPDTKDWGPSGMQAYYSLLQPMVNAIESYLVAHPEIKNVYVTGHSLGASMVEQFMSDHSGGKFQAVTFANPGYPGAGGTDDRMTSIDNFGDPVVSIGNTIYPVRGDIAQLVDFNGPPTLNPTNIHDMALYRDEVQFFSG